MKIYFAMVSSGIEDNETFSTLFVENSVSTGATSDVVFGLDLDLLLAVGTEVLYPVLLDFHILLLIAFGFHPDRTGKKIDSRKNLKRVEVKLISASSNTSLSRASRLRFCATRWLKLQQRRPGVQAQHFCPELNLK